MGALFLHVDWLDGSRAANQQAEKARAFERSKNRLKTYALPCISFHFHRSFVAMLAIEIIDVLMIYYFSLQQH
jgi:hypothetical protein